LIAEVETASYVMDNSFYKMKSEFFVVKVDFLLKDGYYKQFKHFIPFFKNLVGAIWQSGHRDSESEQLLAGKQIDQVILLESYSVEDVFEGRIVTHQRNFVVLDDSQQASFEGLEGEEGQLLCKAGHEIAYGLEVVVFAVEEVHKRTCSFDIGIF
jgi:hypothetical protein